MQRKSSDTKLGEFGSPAQAADSKATDRALRSRAATYDVSDDELSAHCFWRRWKSGIGGWQHLLTDAG